MHKLLQFPVEMDTRGSKTTTTFIPFHIKNDLPLQYVPEQRIKNTAIRACTNIIKM